MPLPYLIEKYSQTVGKRTEIDDVMTATLLLQRLLGHQVLDPNWTWRRFCHYHVFTVFLFTYVILGTLNVINRPDVDSGLKDEAFYTLFYLAASPIKLVLLINNRNLFRELYVTVKTTLFRMIKAHSGFSTEDILRKFKKSVYPLFSLVVIPFFAYESVPAWNYLNGNRKLMSPATDTLLPMTTPYYEAAWFLHSAYFIQLNTILLITDVWFVFFMTAFGLAADCVANLLDVQKSAEGETQADYGRRLNEALRTFYESHIKLVRYHSKLGELYKWLSLIPLVHASLTMCVVLLAISEEFSLKYATSLVPPFSEALVYSWFGEQLREKINAIEKALLNFDWTNLHRKDVKSYYNIVCYMQRDFGIKTAIGHELSMVTMTNVLRSSYRAFTVLRSMN